MDALRRYCGRRHTRGTFPSSPPRGGFEALLDMLKETDLRLNFTEALRSAAAFEVFDRAVLRPRLLLCLHGIGTNTGLQRMNAAHHGVSYRELVYVRRRYLAVDHLRKAIAIVANGTLHARNPAIWGDGTTAHRIPSTSPPWTRTSPRNGI
jgi:hypothetical protein